MGVQFRANPEKPTVGPVAFRQTITRGIPMPALAVENFSHSFARLNGVFRTIHPERGLAARETDAPRFFAQHVDLLAGHGGSICFQQVGIFVHNSFSTPRF